MRIDELKSNKSDVNAIALTIDYIHKQLEYQSNIAVSTLGQICNDKDDD